MNRESKAALLRKSFFVATEDRLNKNLQNQIFESLQGQDEASVVVVDGGKRTKTTEKGNEVAEQTDPEKPTDEVAEKLHVLVEVGFLAIGRYRAYMLPRQC